MFLSTDGESQWSFSFIKMWKWCSWDRALVNLKLVASYFIHFQLYWGITDKQYCKIFKEYNMMIWYTYILWKDSPRWVNIPRIYFFVCVRTFNFCSISRFQLYNTVLSAVVTMFYIRSSDLIHSITECSYHFISFSLFLPPLATTFHFSVSMSSTFFIFKIPHIVTLCSIFFFHLTLTYFT